MGAREEEKEINSSSARRMGFGVRGLLGVSGFILQCLVPKLGGAWVPLAGAGTPVGYFLKCFHNCLAFQGQGPFI